MKAADLVALARPGEILLDYEMCRVEEFISLFEQCLDRVSATPERPMLVDVIAARAEAEIIWKYDRETSDGKYVRALAERNVDLRCARQEYFASMEHQFRGRNLILQALDQNRDFISCVHASIRGEPADSPGKKIKVPNLRSKNRA